MAPRTDLPADGPDWHPEYQRVSDWSQVPYFEVMTCKLTEGRSTTHVKAGGEMIRKFRERNVRYRGPYHWLRPDSPGDVQARVFIAAIEQELGDLMPEEIWQTDWERTLGNDGKPLKPRSIPSIAIVDAFVGTVEARWPGRGLMYSAPWVDDAEDGETFEEWRSLHPEYPLWLADYSQHSHDNAIKWNAVLLQWTSGYPMPYVKLGRSDMNMIIDRAQLDQMTGRSTVKPDPEPPVVVVPTTPPYTEPGDDMANIGIIHPADADAEFWGYFVGPIDGPRFLELHWINTQQKIDAAKKHIAAGAAVFGHFQGMEPTVGAAALTKANLAPCICDALPTGDNKTTWSGDDLIVG